MKKILSLTLFSFFLFSTSYASHLLGADISYECLGPGQYTVTLSLFRDCNGITPSSSQTMSYSSVSCNNISGSIQLSSVGTPTDITPLCPSEASACGGNGSFGVQEWIYQGTLNLPPGCGNDWMLGWSQCCRNGTINTLSSPSSQDMYVGAVLDNTTTPVCNSSPEFNNAPGSIVCVNQPVIYNHGVSDADGDSLYFSFGTCYEANNNSVNYSGGFSVANPLTTVNPIQIDPNTGAISFTPSTQQVGVLCVNVKEYRNGALIGEINRDMQFTVIACSNVPPQATGVDSLPNNDPVNFATSVCANGDLCFTIDGFDANANNVNLSWNAEITGASFTVTNNGTTNPSAEFCWNPGPGDIGQHFFTVNVEDDACPIIGQGTYTYIIDVTPSPNTLDAGLDTYLCFGESVGLNATSVPAAASYSWTPAATLSSSTIPNPSANPLTTTVYEVTASFPDGCDLTDVVAVVVGAPLSVDVTPSNPFNCAGQNTDLTATSNGNIVAYDWTPGGLTGQTVTVTPLVTTTYNVEVEDDNGCTADQDVTVTIAAPSGNVCNVLYVTPTGTAVGTGSKASPLDLATALEVGACNGTTIKMAIGDYVTDTTINRVTSYLTLEGGFDPNINWDKVSTAGATRILRNATQTYSLISGSIVAGSGIDNETGANPEVVAIEVSNQSEFRFQDITIETVLNDAPTETHAGYNGVDVYGVRLNTCDGYNVVRTQIIADQGGAGGNQIFTIAATDGGNSVGLQANTNGAGSNLIQSRILAGAGGAGGTGGGSAGSSNNVQWTGTNFVTNVNNFNLPGQPTIRMDDIACTATNITFESTSSNWNFGAGSTPNTANGASVVSMYNSLGRKDITHSTDSYSGFANILLDSQVLPTFTTSAPFVQGHYRVCAGSDISFTATNGGVGYNYIWDLGGGAVPNNFNGVNFETITNNSFNVPGIYTITLNYETNCCGVSLPTTLDIYVEEEPSLSLVASSPNLCAGSGTPVTITADDNINFGTINWSPSSGLDFSDTYVVNASPGDTTQYYVLVADSTGLCVTGDTITVDVINIELTTSSTEASCGPNGSATVTVTGGSGNYGYSWDDVANQTTATATGLGVGTYNVMVMDLTLGCLDSATVVVNPSLNSLVAFVNDVTPVSCIGEGDGNLTITVTGGTAPFDYVFSPAGGSLLATNNTSFTSTNLSGGTYTCLVTDDNGCTYSVDGFISEPDSIVLSIDSLLDPTCVGLNNGYLEVLADGGNGGHTYLWDNGETTRAINNLGVGTYCVTSTDLNGCMDSACFVLTAPLITSTVDTTICFQDTYVLPDGQIINPSTNLTAVDTVSGLSGCDSVVTTNITINALPTIVANVLPNDTLCQNDSVTLFGSGAATYIWNNSVNDSVAFVQSVGTTTYTVTGTDLNGCVDSTTIDVLVNPLPTVVANAAPNDTLCQNEQVTLTGTGADTYVWDNGVTDGVAFVQAVGSTTYTVEGTDINGCVNSDTVAILVNALPTIGIIAFPNDTICQNDTLILSGTGGISYVWDNGVVDSVGFVSPIGTTTYTVTGTDANGCVNTQTIDITVNALPNVTIAAFPNDTLCENDTLILSGIGADAYVWDNAVIDSVGFVPPVGSTTYSMIGTDINGCSDTAVAITIQVNSLPTVGSIALPNDTLCENDTLILSGTGAVTYTWNNSVVDSVAFVQPVGTTSYTVTGTDINGCINYDTLAVLVNALPLIGTNAAPNDTLCENDTVTLTGSGGLTYSWDNSVVDGVGFVSPVGTITYTVTGTDANGCVNLDSLDVFINALPLIGTNVLPNDSVCENESMILSGTGGLTYSWDNGITNGTAFVQAVGTTTYTVVGTDANTCENSASIDLTVIALPNVGTSSAPNDTLCENDTVTLTGTGADTYIWNNGVTEGVAFVSPVGTTTYTVTGAIDFGCENTATIDVLVNALPTIGTSIAPNDTVCFGEEFTLMGSGGVSYLWDNSVVNDEAFVQEVGNTTYLVTGTDANGCVNFDSIQLTVNPLPSLSATANPDTIFLGDFSTLIGTGTGDFVWDNIQFGAQYEVDPSVETAYSVTLTDANGCVSDTSVTVYIMGITSEQLVIPNAFSPNGDNNNDIFRVVTDQYFEEIEMIIYNRWGEILHKEVGPQNHGWDGKYQGENQPVDSYVYMVRVKALDGQDFVLSGTVALFR